MKKKQEKRKENFPNVIRKASKKFAEQTLYNSVGAAEFYSKEKNR